MLTAKDGSLWVGTATGLHKFDPRTGEVLERYAASANDPNALQGKYVQATVEDDQGVIWVGTTGGGLNRLDPKEKTFSHYRADAAKPHRIANNFIYRLANFAGAPDLIWIATVDGLSVLNKRDNTVTNYVYNRGKGRQGRSGRENCPYDYSGSVRDFLVGGQRTWLFTENRPGRPPISEHPPQPKPQRGLCGRYRSASIGP